VAERALKSAAGGKPPAAPVSGPRWRERRDRPFYAVEIWPNQSLSRNGLHIVLWITGIGLAVPLVAMTGTPVFWGLLPFAIATFAAIRHAFRRNRRNLRLTETFSVWRDEVRVERREPDGRRLRWQAEPVRARVRLQAGARIEDYLTLTGGGREIELGAFLAPEERVALANEIEAALIRAVRG